MTRPTWWLGDANDGNLVGLDARMALDQRTHLVVATRSFVAWDGSAFVPIKAGITRLAPTHDIARAAPDAWSLAPTVSSRRRDGAWEIRDGSSAVTLAPTASAGEDTNTLAGYFSVFDTWTEIDSFFEGSFLERIAPGAFVKTLREDRQLLLFEHGYDPQIGKKPIAAIDSAEEDAVGAAYRATLIDGLDPLIVNGLAAGQYGASFRFSVQREEIVQEPEPSDYNPKGLPERTVQEAKVFEFGPVAFPAYADATATLAA